MARFKNNMKGVFLGAAAMALLSGVLAGCSSNATIKEDPATLQKRTTAANGIRSYFDKSHGNYDSLSAEDKAALNALTGSEQNSRTAFTHMVPSQGAPAGGGSPASGPGVH